MELQGTAVFGADIQRPNFSQHPTPHFLKCSDPPDSECSNLTFEVEFKVAEDERAPRQGDLQVSCCGSLHILDVLAGKSEHHLGTGKRGLYFTEQAIT